MNFRNLFRLTFVIFFLYLMGDAFYRWDGFKYYASFFEFLPAVAIISILWSLLAVFTSIFIWLLFKTIEWLCRHMKLRIDTRHLLLFLGFFVLFGMMVWGIKIRIWPEAQTTLRLKIGLLTCITGISLFLTWMFRKKTDEWLELVHIRITPLVWLFGAVVLLSLPLTVYLVWSNQTKKTASENNMAYSAADKKKPNIILITFDALTALDMSVYGYHRQTTPFISEWAKSASVFTRAKVAADFTTASTTSLMTGKRVWSHRRFQIEGLLKSDTENLPLLLKNDGYYNMAFIANRLASVQTQGMSESFAVAPPSDEFISPASLYGLFYKILVKFIGTKIGLYDWILKEDFILYKLLPGDYFRFPYKSEFPVEKAFNIFMTAINSNPREPYFSWIHVFPPHAPYLPPRQYLGFFDHSPGLRKWKDQYKLVQPRYFSQEQQHDVDILKARYDEFIRYCDEQFRYFIEQLGKRDLLKNTVIILSADHGESFAHGYLTHGTPLLNETTNHIPLIIKQPDQAEGKIIDDLVEQIDISATILDLSGIPIPSWMEGRSLLPLIRGEKLPARPAFSMDLSLNSKARKIEKGIIAVWEGDYKLVHSLDNKKSLLFNLKLDPNELNDLYGKEHEVGKKLLGLIMDNLATVNKGFGAEE